MPPKKCTSICTKKKELHDCNSDPRCKYANGKLRKYCYLSNKYTFDDKCNIITKASKNNPVKGPKRTRSLPKNEEPKKRTKKQTIKKVDPFNLLKKYSSSSSSKKVKRNIHRKPGYIIESDSPVEKTIKKVDPFNLFNGYSSSKQLKKDIINPDSPVEKTINKINPFNLINEYSSSNSSKHVKRNIHRRPFTIIESDSPLEKTINKINPFNLIQGYSSSNSSKHVKRNTHKKSRYIINSSSS